MKTIKEQKRQLKLKLQITAIISYLIHSSICIAIVVIASLSIKENQDSDQVVQWCTIEISFIGYLLLQYIYELWNQFYFINLIKIPFCNSLQDILTYHFFTRYLASNIFFLCVSDYIYVLFFSGNWFFRESQREIPGSGRWSECYDSEDGRYYACFIYDYETIAPQYHGPYLTQLANLNVTLFSFAVAYLYGRIFLAIVINGERNIIQSKLIKINIYSVKKRSQIACIILIIYYICRATHSFIIYSQVKNESLVYCIGAYIFYSVMMITVLGSIIIILQLKFTKAENQNSKQEFICVFTLIDLIIYQNKPLNYYFWIMLIVSFSLTCFGVHKYSRDENIQDIVNFQNYVLADLIVAQMVFITYLSIKYVPFFQKYLKNIFIQSEFNINFSQVDLYYNFINFKPKENQIDQNKKNKADQEVKKEEYIFSEIE